MHRQRGLAPNRGGARSPRKSRSDNVGCVLSGALRFVDGGGRWAAMSVRDASSAGRRLIGSTITLDLGSARLDVADRNADGVVNNRDLLPGDDVRVSVRLSRAATAQPGIVPVGRLAASAPV
jgi:hypothetical protein